ncbi:hypothetical protein PR202_gb26209 [Eleusine coracana subsp. coracana]|uniref:Uncharacterized protein n=1 Tax=Eleusine coracana subsp. coracana TaxID=191504 RepID=A0AAV5FS35_ELECO|nr:hypothetical protein PR202_gb26209 [Eleusine coracana subsp. coracana]
MAILTADPAGKQHRQGACLKEKKGAKDDMVEFEPALSAGLVYPYTAAMTSAGHPRRAATIRRGQQERELAGDV